MFLGLALLVDPMRLGIAGILMSRRQSIRTLFAFWIGGIAAGVIVAIAVLVVLRDVALVAIHTAISTINDARSAVIILTGGRLQITLGVLALVALAVMLARQRSLITVRFDRTRVATPVPVPVGGGSAADSTAEIVQPRKPTLVARLAAVTQDMLERERVWPAFLAGFASTVPPIEGPMVLTVIMASEAALTTQVSAFAVFILLVLVFIEIPLVSYLIAPQKTQAAMLHISTWVHSHRQQIMQTLLAVTGVMLLVQGVGRL